MKEVCLITGASGDIGRTIAKVLAVKGYQLILHVHQNQLAIEELLKEIPEESVIKVIKKNLSNQIDTEQFLTEIDVHVDHVVFASGTSLYGLFQDTLNVEMDNMLQIHVKSPWMITKHVLPSQIRKRNGTITFISSIWGKNGASCEVIYSAVKGSQNTFVKALAKEVGPSGIRVNAVSPGFIDTKMNHQFSQEEKSAIIEDIPAGKAGQPEDIANLVSFLISEHAHYINGQIVGVDGGWS